MFYSDICRHALVDQSAAMHYGAQCGLYQLPMSVISTSCETVYTTKSKAITNFCAIIRSNMGYDDINYLCHVRSSARLRN